MSLVGLRVGLVGPLPPPAGGMANQLQQLQQCLLQEGVCVAVVQSNRAYRPAWIGRLPGVRAFFRLLPYLAALWRAARHSDVFHVMANSGWSWHLFAAPAVWVAHANRVPVIVNYHGGAAEEFLVKAQSVVRWTMRHVAVLTVPSGFLRQVFSRFGMQSTIVPNVVDLVKFSSQGHFPRPRRHLIVARNLEPIYDIGTAIRAFALIHARYPDSHLTVAGSGPEQGSLSALVEQLGVSDAVHFAGRLDVNGMAALYRDADIALNSSLVDNMPVSLLEAMASGVPVVSTDVGGIPFLVEHGMTALLVPPAAPKEMAEAICSLIEDESLAELLVCNGREQSQRFTWQRVWPTLADTYRTALAAAARPKS